MRTLVVVCLAGGLAAAPVSAQSPPPVETSAAAAAPAAAPPPPPESPSDVAAFFKGTEIGGLLDAHFSWYTTKPEGDASFRNFDTRHNQFRVSMAQLWIAKAPAADSRAGFKVKLSVGPATTIVQSLEPGSSPAVLQNIEEGFVSYLAPIGKGLQFDVGKFVTQHGAEVIESKDNWNYSRSMLFALAIPYYHSGVRATYSPHAKVTVMGTIVNGWNNVVENNGAKTFGAQVAYKPTAALSLVQNYMTGPEQSGNNENWRQLSDTTATLTVNPKLSLMVNYDYGADVVDGVRTHWQGVAGYARIQPNKWVAFSPRFEWYDDAQGFTTGTVQTLREVTGTFEVKPTDSFIWRFEYRTDLSDTAVFKSSGGGLKKKQTSVGMGVIYSFAYKG
ncbi:MAG TPA: porin [Vicinamibacterales bacterium]|nr:porin [Vicinamibacterales bacterium]